MEGILVSKHVKSMLLPGDIESVGDQVITHLHHLHQSQGKFWGQNVSRLALALR